MPIAKIDGIVQNPEFSENKNLECCVTAQNEKTDVGLRLDEHVEFSEYDGSACNQDR